MHELALLFGKPDAANIARQLRGGASKGFGFIDYAVAEQARGAIAALAGRKVDGQALKVFEATALTPHPWSK